ncbi:outer membrane beta-barrel protein [Altibacter sp. HG106]|uniref:outer membrane beta-barrel protein n=1 Tax=Altibacter sp. HG106 TaxID=3023937 RepID=UPI0023508903|nr:outer membrane beta-barrel family protein [Altibacter sp. HG106]MDC7994957.1 outer membrane beta-barrel family protein [Altibacter sp. HG106]
MSRALILLVLCVFITSHAQQVSVQGTVVDNANKPVSFATVLLLDASGETSLQGTATDEDGSFRLQPVNSGSYTLQISYLGFQTQTLSLSLPKDNPLGTITLVENTEQLGETVITSKEPILRKEPGKLVFTIENTALATGNTFDLLKKTPGVVVLGNDIQIKFSTPVIYINDKRVYLSASEVASLLQNTDASAIKEIEVITNPSAQFDAEAGTALNIKTSRAIAIGYKGTVSGTYEQAVFAKYNVATSHFYKNNWLNLYGSYSFSPRKELKQDDNAIEFFNPDNSTKSFWETDFSRITRSYAHQANLVADIEINEANSLNLNVSGQVSPDKTYQNDVFGIISNAQQQRDSTFNTNSFLENDTATFSTAVTHDLTLNDKGASLRTTVNYIRYQFDQMQQVNTRYFSPDNAILRNNRFRTEALQETAIFSGQTDVTTSIGGMSFSGGLKYSYIDTESGLDFFDSDLEATPQFNDALSDLFLYQEKIYAAYAEASKEGERWSAVFGLRAEYTDVNGDSQSLGVVNTQSYFELFPNVSVQHTLKNQNTIGLSYARRIQRPRYQSLNPFRYFLNENNFSGGNPNLRPSIENKISLEYAHKRKLFIEAYYQHHKNYLDKLTFQDNENSTLFTVDANLIEEFQYSLDIIYNSYVRPWWYLSVVTSSFYIENEFFSIASPQETASNSTYGFFGQTFHRLTLSKEANWTADIVAYYFSNLIAGSFSYKNRFNLSVSFRKSFWDDRASLTMGVDDIFFTDPIRLTSRYYNQNNSYLARGPSRLFRVGFQYNFGNARLRDNRGTIESDEGDRLE